MKRKERIREVFPAPPSPEYWAEKAGKGWKLVAAEWELDGETGPEEVQWVEDIPYGMKVAEDCRRLVENAREKEALILMIEMIVADKPLSEVAASLNDRGFSMRSGAPWTQIDVFQLLPRLVEVASRVYPTRDWSDRRRRIYKLAR